MPGGITFLASLNANIVTPPAGKATVFFSIDSGVPSYKDSTGTVFPLGTTGSPGAAGAQGVPGENGLDGETIVGPPGNTGPQGVTGSTGAQGAMGPVLPFALDAYEPDLPVLPAGALSSATGAAPKSTTVLTTGVGATYNVPAGITAIIVEVIGGGGGGGGADASGGPQCGAAGGGGGGSYARKVYTVVPAQAFTYTVGTGGTGGSAGPNAGNAGNNSTFDNAGTIVTANGGTGGGAATAGTSVVAVGGGVGGGATNGQVNMRGPSRAGTGFRFSGSFALGGMGGHSLYGPGAPNNNVDATAANAIAGGGGGGAGATALTAGRAGGNGADGFIIITEFGT